MAVAGAVALTGCASGGAGQAQQRGGISGPVGSQPDAEDIQTGGTLTFGTFNLPAVLDPAKTVPSGSTGGTEMAAVYDLLMRYDDMAGEFVPQLAEALEASEDGKTWTLTLREGARFSNGEPVDAEAVVWSIERYVANRGSDSQLWSSSVESMTANNPRTVVFVLGKPWLTFPNMLATGPGMIVAKQAVDGESFTPIGAGPFTLEAHKPNEEILLERRADYWSGPAHLDAVRIIPAADGRQQLDMFRAGEIQLAFLYDAQIAAEVADAGYPGVLSVMNAGSAILINNAEGRPGSDIDVRRAIDLAVDPVLIDERGQGGMGRPSTALFSSASQWDSGAPQSRYDPEEARMLVAAAKAKGFDGKITFVTRQAPEAQARALAIQSMLNNVGFDLTVDYVTSVTDMVRVMYVERNYDLGQTGLNIRESAPFLKLYSSFHSESNGNVSGYSNPQMDALLDRLQAATDVAAESALIGEIEQLAADTVPTVPVSAQDNLVIWQENVHGVQHTFADIVLLGDAWIA
ncbi:ABC transporter substrate-binding protein [Tomitella biformata]|uniref:ABC transporter substrate-binding protein n=1 Tax=Tomitella biformata TaxID=630403 RepID=UPI00046481F3|nr:ABC transporter substrate-binding protein [Tomitella biformata]